MENFDWRTAGIGACVMLVVTALGALLRHLVRGKEAKAETGGAFFKAATKPKEKTKEKAYAF